MIATTSSYIKIKNKLTVSMAERISRVQHISSASSTGYVVMSIRDRAAETLCMTPGFLEYAQLEANRRGDQIAAVVREECNAYSAIEQLQLKRLPTFHPADASNYDHPYLAGDDQESPFE